MVSLVAQRLAGGNFGAEYCILQFGGHGPYQLKIQILSSGRPVIGIKEASSGMDSDRNSA